MAALESFLASRNPPDEFRQLLRACNAESVRDVASLAANADELKTNVFTLLDIPGVSDTGDIAPAAKASQKERSDALRITAKVRTIWEDACKSTGDSAELVANGEKEASVYDHAPSTITIRFKFGQLFQRI